MYNEHMNVHERLMVGFAIIAGEMLKENEKDEHPAKVMSEAMTCLVANELEGDNIDETLKIFKSADKETRDEMF